MRGYRYSAVGFAIGFMTVVRYLEQGDLVAWMALLGAIALEVLATVSLKTADGFSRFWPSVLVVVGYVGCFSLLGFALKTFDVGLVYAIWSAIGTAAITIIGVMLFGESITIPRISGVILIVLGVIVLNLSGGEAHGAHGGGSADRSDPQHSAVEPETARPEPTLGSSALAVSLAADMVRRSQPDETTTVGGVPKPREHRPESGEIPMLTPRTGLIPRQMRPRHDMEIDPDSDLRPIFPDLSGPEI